MTLSLARKTCQMTQKWTKVRRIPILKPPPGRELCKLPASKLSDSLCRMTHISKWKSLKKILSLILKWILYISFSFQQQRTFLQKETQKDKRKYEIIIYLDETANGPNFLFTPFVKLKEEKWFWFLFVNNWILDDKTNMMNLGQPTLGSSAVVCANIRKCIYLKYIQWFMFYEGIFDGNWFIESLKIL